VRRRCWVALICRRQAVVDRGEAADLLGHLAADGRELGPHLAADGRKLSAHLRADLLRGNISGNACTFEDTMQAEGQTMTGLSFMRAEP
jgi:hypothetical protein